MLLFMDGFDHYASADIAKKWSAVSGSCVIAAGAGRRGGGALDTGASGSYHVTKALPANYAALIVGVAFNPAGAAPPISAKFIDFLDASLSQFDVRYNSTGTVSVTRGGTVIGTTAATIAAAGFTYIEIAVTFHASAGTVGLRFNGVSVLSLTAQNTISTANAFANAVRFGQFSTSGNNSYFDDFYCCDTSGATNNSFLGDSRIDTLRPSADGTYSQLTPSTGTSHFALVKENVPSTVDYVSGGTTGLKDTYALTDLTGAAIVFAIQVNNLIYKDDAGLRQGANLLRSGSIDAQGATVTLSTTPLYAVSVHETDPATSAAWSQTGVNALEAGVIITG